MNRLKPIQLNGRFVRLEPFAAQHLSGLARFANNPKIWRYMAGGGYWNESELAALLALRKKQEASGRWLPFAVVLQEGDHLVGCSNYLEIRPDHFGLEIGGTWYGEPFWGTAVNPECKYLLLQHAFETLQYKRVQIKTDERNIHSQRGIEKLGARKEGVLRKQILMPDGHMRNTVYYSVLAEEWGEVKAALELRLSRMSAPIFPE